MEGLIAFHPPMDPAEARADPKRESSSRIKNARCVRVSRARMRVGLRRDTFVRFARLPPAPNNEAVIGILGRVCISIQDELAPIDVTFSTVFSQSNFPLASSSFHALVLHFPCSRSPLAFRQPCYRLRARLGSTRDRVRVSIR